MISTTILSHMPMAAAYEGGSGAANAWIGKGPPADRCISVNAANSDSTYCNVVFDNECDRPVVCSLGGTLRLYRNAERIDAPGWLVGRCPSPGRIQKPECYMK